MKPYPLKALLMGLSVMMSIFACTRAERSSEELIRQVVPVTVTVPRRGSISEYTRQVATSKFLIRAMVKSPVTGYIGNCLIALGDPVKKNQELFSVRTQESDALQQDTLSPVHLGGNIPVKASINGIIATLEHPAGDFIQQGDVLATIAEPGSLVFIMELPFEMADIISKGQLLHIELPGGIRKTATVRSVLPDVSEGSQTQKIILETQQNQGIPENLTGMVELVSKRKPNTLILPKSAVLNDEIMKSFWVMRMINDTVAVKTPVTTGIQYLDSVEILSDAIQLSDRILNSGNYGLPDTARVRIVNDK